MFKRVLLTLALAAASANAFAAGVTYRLDPAHTNVLASWSHFGFSHPSAQFGAADGTLVYDADDVSKSRVEVTLPLSGLDSFVPKLDEHLRSADFFDVAKYPTITYSGKLVFTGDTPTGVDGSLTLHGVTKPVPLTINSFKCIEHPMLKREDCGADASADFNRADFGRTKAATGELGQVHIDIQVEALKD